MGAIELGFYSILDVEHEHIKDLMLLLKHNCIWFFNDKNEWLTLRNMVTVMNNKQKKQEGYSIKYKLRTGFFLMWA